MKTRKLALGAVAGAVGLLSLASAGIAVADDGTTTPPPVDAGGGMHRHGAGPAGDGAGTMRGEGTGVFHEQVHAAAAQALGITVADLEARLAEGKTLTEIAAELGVDVAPVKDAMQDARPAGRGAGMGAGGMRNGQGRGAADCPYAP